jgi:hypothetical protein
MLRYCAIPASAAHDSPHVAHYLNHHLAAFRAPTLHTLDINAGW